MGSLFWCIFSVLLSVVCVLRCLSVVCRDLLLLLSRAACSYAIICLFSGFRLSFSLCGFVSGLAFICLVWRYFG